MKKKSVSQELRNSFPLIKEVYFHYANIYSLQCWKSAIAEFVIRVEALSLEHGTKSDNASCTSEN